MTTVAPKWDELVPLPIIFDPKARITRLQSTLIPGNPHYEHLQQHPNIRAAIALYESGELDGRRKVFICGGKVVGKEEALSSGLPVWSEGGFYHQFIQKASYPYDPQMSGHSLLIEARLLTAYGGQGILRRMQVLWDTGSNVLSIFEHDLMALAGNQETLDRYLYRGNADILTADGALSCFRTFWIEYRFCDPPTGFAWSAWMYEEAIVRPLTPGRCRLSLERQWAIVITLEQGLPRPTFQLHRPKGE